MASDDPGENPTSNPSKSASNRAGKSPSKSAGIDVDTALTRMPKTELHLHLEGAVAAATLSDLATKHGVALPDHDEPEDLYRFQNLVDFLTMYTVVCHSIRDREDFRRVTFECLERCHSAGARYVELFFSPESHLEIGVDYGTMLDGVLQGMADASTDLGLAANLIPAINREHGPKRAVEFVQMVIDDRRPGVLGVGLDFNEDGFPPADYVDAYRLAAKAGLRRTSHEGEVGPASNVRDSIDILGCERVDHGYHIVDDPALMQRCVESQIPFTACPTTTTYTTVFRDLGSPDHAIRRMADAGLKLTVNSDDPTMMGTDLASEYKVLHHTMGLDLPQLKAFALNGIDAAWVDDSTKRQWRSDWTTEIDQLFASVNVESDDD